VKDGGKLVLEKKFHKTGFDELLENEPYKPYLDALFAHHMTKRLKDLSAADVDTDSYVEVQAISDELSEQIAPE
jgi:hypothetical protein